MYAMPGGALAHSLIIARVIFLLSLRLGGAARSFRAPRRILGGAQYLPRRDGVCGPPKLANDQKETLLNPSVIVEVLSKSTEARDRGFKFAQYRRLESLG